MHLDWWTLALQTINFLILVWLLQRFLYRPVVAVIGRRREEIQRVMAEANRANTAAEEQRHRLEEARTAAVAERDQLLTQARAQVEQEKELALAATRAESEKLIAEVRARLGAEREAETERLQQHAAGLGIAVARRLLERTAPAHPLHPFLDRVAAVIGSMSADERSRMTRQMAGDGATLACAVPLTSDLVRECVECLSPLLGTEMKLHIAVEPSLIAGIELRFPNLVIGDNWRDSLAAAVAALTGHERTDAVA